MKCESCGNEMIGAAIICRACNHNNALHKRLAWRRSEPRYDKTTRPHASGAPAPAELPTIAPRKDTDLKLLHFPSAQNKRSDVSQAQPARQSRDENQSQTAAYPPWRAELKERVRRIMEKRAKGERAAPNTSPIQPTRAQTGEAKLGRNPIVEAALNRIRWAERERERRGDRATGRRGGKATDNQADSEKNLSAPTPPHRPVAVQSGPAVPTSPRPSVSTSRAPSKNSTGKASISEPPAGAPDKQVRARVSEIALAHESSPVKADPAPLHARLMAGVCDFEIVFVAFLLVFGAYTTSDNPTSFAYGSRLLMALLFSAVIFTYQIVMLALADRTFGMALLNLNLVNTDDESLPITFRQKLLRASASTIMFICFPLYLTAWFSVSRRTLPDLVSGTTVA